MPPMQSRFEFSIQKEEAIGGTLPEGNVLKIGPLELEASGDYIILLRDEFRSGYECQRCLGLGEEKCENCAGSGRSMVVKDGRCVRCEGTGNIACVHCGGKGVEEG